LHPRWMHALFRPGQCRNDPTHRTLSRRHTSSWHGSSSRCGRENGMLPQVCWSLSPTIANAPTRHLYSAVSNQLQAKQNRGLMRSGWGCFTRCSASDRNAVCHTPSGKKSLRKIESPRPPGSRHAVLQLASTRRDQAPAGEQSSALQLFTSEG